MVARPTARSASRAFFAEVADNEPLSAQYTFDEGVAQLGKSVNPRNRRQTAKTATFRTRVINLQKKKKNNNSSRYATNTGDGSRCVADEIAESIGGVVVRLSAHRRKIEIAKKRNSHSWTHFLAVSVIIAVTLQ